MLLRLNLLIFFYIQLSWISYVLIVIDNFNQLPGTTQEIVKHNL